MAAQEKTGKKQAGPESSPPHYACNHCYQSKVKCNGHVPCPRCVEKSLPCRPREIKRGGRRRRGEKEGGAQRPPPLKRPSPLATGQPLLDLVLTQANPMGDAELYMRCFRQLLKDGRVVRERVVGHLKRLRVLSEICQGDCTWGIAAAMTRLLKVSPVELEDPGALAFHPLLTSSKARATVMVQLMQETQQLQQSVRFRQFDDGATPMYMSVPRATGLAVAANKSYQESHLAAHDIYDQIVSKRVMSMLSGAAVVVPQDREQYIFKMVEFMYTDVRQSTDIFKAFLNDGEVRIYIVKARRLQLEGEETVVVTTEPIRHSRHITDTPGMVHKVVQQYRYYGSAQTQQQEQQVSLLVRPPAPSMGVGGGTRGPATEAAAATGPASSSSLASHRPPAPATAAAPPSFPALAVLPLDPPPTADVKELMACYDDGARLARIFPRRPMWGSAPMPPLSIPTLPSSLPLGMPKNPQPARALPPSPQLPTDMAPVEAGGTGAGSAGADVDADEPLLDEEMIELLERLDSGEEGEEDGET